MFRELALFLVLFVFVDCKGKCSKYAFDGRPKEWSKPLESLHAKSFYTKAECEVECKAKQGCNWFRIKKSADRPYGGCELYEHATISGAHTINFEVYELVDCASDVYDTKNAFEKIGGGTCAWSWNDVDWIARDLSLSSRNRGITGKSLQWCQAECNGLNECLYISYTSLSGGWCYLWKGVACTPTGLKSYDTYKKKKNAVLCTVGGQNYKVGDVFYAGACSRCECRGENNHVCEPLCPKEKQTKCSSGQREVMRHKRIPGTGCDCQQTHCIDKATTAPAPTDPSCLKRGAAYSFSTKSYNSVETWQACDQYCVDEQSMQCLAWSYRVKMKMCFLYNKLTTARANAEFVSGTRGCAGCIETGVFYMGPDIHTEITESIESCQAKCKEVKRCNYFVWLQFGQHKNRCFLKEKKTGFTKLAGVTSGTKDCQKVEKKKIIEIITKPDCTEDHTRLKDLTNKKFLTCNEALLSHNKMCTDESVKEACCITCV